MTSANQRKLILGFNAFAALALQPAHTKRILYDFLCLEISILYFPEALRILFGGSFFDSYTGTLPLRFLL